MEEAHCLFCYKTKKLKDMIIAFPSGTGGCHKCYDKWEKKKVIK